ncbi:MAG: pyridoxamine 5'-phosphate oxidase [Crocinitomix sp.]|jgi:pyridoxamine 5'-phosphate oxidase
MDQANKKKIDRADFLKGKLEEAAHTDPMKLFSVWYQEAIEKSCADPHAVVLTTATTDGKPSSRIVYMRDLLEEGVIIYTNYTSRKGVEITENPNVALLFYWDCCERQVRLEGRVKKINPLISDDYFAARPRISQIGAWASEQSSVIPDRASLEERVAYYEKKFPNEVPRPPHWGGLIVEPAYFEFWQGRLGRLHDRICFEKESNDWATYRIAP